MFQHKRIRPQRDLPGTTCLFQQSPALQCSDEDQMVGWAAEAHSPCVPHSLPPAADDRCPAPDLMKNCTQGPIWGMRLAGPLQACKDPEDSHSPIRIGTPLQRSGHSWPWVPRVFAATSSAPAAHPLLHFLRSIGILAARLWAKEPAPQGPASQGPWQRAIGTEHPTE